ncbi:MAG TPA: hypothetical protein VFM29_07890 [Vicinamibacteria bacterium]|nr:hypothetical protein [Vicinamibacteria bacterium]
MADKGSRDEVLVEVREALLRVARSTAVAAVEPETYSVTLTALERVNTTLGLSPRDGLGG